MFIKTNNNNYYFNFMVRSVGLTDAVLEPNRSVVSIVTLAFKMFWLSCSLEFE